MTGVSPNHGPDVGGDVITVIGTNLGSASGVEIDGAAADFVPIDNTDRQVTTPDHVPGTVHVTVDGPGGSSAISAADRYTYAVEGTPT